eukprot:c33076_g1_i1.p1 GENE.c33076_g1_i1~~c33076_g1_i1.p1  ORF type:complete len:588 (+),score=149.51 c33076_g1_i1:55-1818(+)
MKGACVWFHVRKGFGFVKPDEGEKDVYVHYTSLKAEGFAKLVPSQRVSFDVETSEDGRVRATNVTEEDGSLIKERPRVRRERPPKDAPTTGSSNEPKSAAEGGEAKPKPKRTRKPKKAKTDKDATDQPKQDAAPATDAKEKPKRKRNRKPKAPAADGDAKAAAPKPKQDKPKKRQLRPPRPIEETADMKSLRDQAVKLLSAKFKAQAVGVGYASGRVNLIGEHVDYVDGIVLPFAIHMGTCVAVSSRPADASGPHVRVFSANIPDAKASQHFDIDDAPASESWVNYVKGVVYHFNASVAPVPKIDLAIVSTVPLGSGLSSSASVEVAVAVALEIVTGVKAKTLVKRALLCQQAEHTFAKVPCGVMDQFVVSLARPNTFLRLDCRSNRSRRYLFRSDLKILVTNTNVKHALGDGEYAKRCVSCKEALELLQKSHPDLKSLRDVTKEMIEEAAKAHPDSVAIKRARHVVGEISRVNLATRALQKRAFNDLGALMYASHDSLRDDYEVSCKELDILVDIAKGLEGVVGSRMTGGGFGGCTVTLVTPEKADEVQATILREYEARTGTKAHSFITVPSLGSHAMAPADKAAE